MATRKVLKAHFENARNELVFFRDLTLDGKKVLVHAGNRNTSTGKAHTFEKSGERFSTVEEARARFDGLVTAAANNFKTQTRSEEDVPVREEGLAHFAENAELEQRVLASPDSLDQARVYADWLQTQGDPRGELAALFQASKDAQAREWVVTHADRLFGELDVKLDSELYDLEWANGFLRGASLKRKNYDSQTDLAAMTRTFLELPTARLVSKLRFGLASYESDNDWTETIAAVAASKQAPHLKALLFNDYTYEDCEISWTAFGDFSPFWKSFPALEVFHLRSSEGGVLGDIELPSLKKFVRESGGLSAAEIESIVKAKWPKLEWLDIWFGSENYNAQGTVAHVQPLLDGKVPATLTHLGFCNAEFTHELIEPLARSKVLGQLKVLDLSKGTLLDGDVDVLLRHAAAFKHLEKLDLSENQLNERADEVAAALPNAVLGEQREGDGDRYTAVGE